jgi:hypothetical protein
MGINVLLGHRNLSECRRDHFKIVLEYYTAIFKTSSITIISPPRGNVQGQLNKDSFLKFKKQ